MKPCLHLHRRQFDAVIFDLDGVVTRTASVHAEAWKRLFDEFLRRRARERGEAFIPFDAESDYLAYVDGMPRLDGIRSFLASRNIELPAGSEEDPPDRETIRSLGERKNGFFLDQLRERGVEVFESTVDLVRRLKKSGFRVAVISASRNCRAVLEAAGVADLFEERVDGIEAEKAGLKGKPAPDVFLEAARRLGVSPGRAVVVEDALAGVEAGRVGGFGCVVGVDRAKQAEALLDRGADLVVEDLACVVVEEPAKKESSIEDLPDGMAALERISRTPEGRVAVFLDYDGTLTPIVERPEDAVLSADTRQTLQLLSEHCIVAIVSGRDLKDVRSLVGLDNLVYAGGHGFDIAGPDGLRTSSREAEEFLPQLDDAEKQLHDSLDAIDGAFIERKKFSIAIHYRRVEESRQGEVGEIVDRTAAHFSGLRKGRGKKVFELQPAIEWNKGKAVLWLLQALDLDPDTVLPVYIGDDITDEDAFRALPPHGIGIAIRGGDHPTVAGYSLRDTEETRRFLNRLAAELSMGSSTDSWSLAYNGFRPAEEGLREALCTLGNGYIATRGAAPEVDAGGSHYPGTYLACGYNRLRTPMGGREVENEDLVNFPNWLPFSFRLEGGDWFNLSRGTALESRQFLDLKEGILRRELRFRDPRGREIVLRQRRLVHMKHPHLAALETVLTAENWSGAITFRSGLDGRVVNAGVPRYGQLRNRHLRVLGAEQVGSDTIALEVETTQSGIRMAQAARTRLFRAGSDRAEEVAAETSITDGWIDQTFTVDVAEGEEITVEKVVGISTSRDFAISEPGLEARKWAARAGRFRDLLAAHSLIWKQLWRRFDMNLSLADPMASARTELILRLHCFHLLQTTSMNTMDLDVGVPSRGWHGEAYRGHVFWDELFIFPFLNLRLPEITRKLLLYRYRRLDEARHAAREAGYRGAMFPWQSGSDGREETQTVHLNPDSGRWLPDNSHLQRHVNAAIAYNVWQYRQATGDNEFFSFHGAEMILEIARFWASLAEPNPATGRYDIVGVMGPDEYHDALPDSDEPGLRNNSYTNVMASWVLCRAREALDLLPEDRRAELRETLGIGDDELLEWDRISRGLTIPFHEDGILSQFEGYEELEELDWERYRQQHGEALRLDRILEAEGDTPNRYKASKQADVLMLFYLFSTDELREMFAHLGYPFEADTVRRNTEYYTHRTSHGSTLSQVVHSWVTARSDRAGAWRLFRQALESDVADIQGGTTPEGIHLGAMAGTVDLVQRCFTGVETRGEVLHLNPRLPSEIRGLRLSLRYRGHSLVIEIAEQSLRIESLHSAERPIRVSHNGKEFTLTEGTVHRFPLQRETV